MKTRILVIEDDASISELICMNLEAAGYEPVPVYDGVEAEKIVSGLAGGGEGACLMRWRWLILCCRARMGLN